MAFILQGTYPIVGANAYVSVADMRAYHSDRGVDTSAYTDSQVQIAIVKATQYLDVRFEYIGSRSTSAQLLEWPRQFAYDDRGDGVYGVPPAVAQATSEYALRALSASLMSDPTVPNSTGRSVRKSEEAVGPIVEKYEYEADRGYEMPNYPLADRILTSRGLVSSGMSGSARGGLMVGTLARGN